MRSFLVSCGLGSVVLLLIGAFGTEPAGAGKVSDPDHQPSVVRLIALGDVNL